MGVNLRGDQGAVTWAGTPTIVDGTQADIDAWDAVITRKKNRHRPYGYALDKITLGGLQIEGRFHIVPIDGQTIGIPTASGATNAVLVLGLKGTTNKYTVKAQVWQLTTGTNSTRNDTTDGWYDFVGAADASTDTIVAA